MDAKELLAEIEKNYPSPNFLQCLLVILIVIFCYLLFFILYCLSPIYFLIILMKKLIKNL